MNTDAIDAADILVTELKEQVALLSQRGATALSNGHLAEAKFFINKIEQFEAFCDDAEKLKAGLDGLYSGFTTELSSDQQHEDSTDVGGRKQDRTDPVLMNNKRKNILRSLEQRYGARLNRRSAAIYRSDDNQVGIVCTMSKWHAKNENYWYAYHPHQNKFLASTKHGYFVLGMMDADIAVALPLDVIRQNLSKLNTTTTSGGRSYWHIHISRSSTGGLSLQRAKGEPPLSLDRYVVPIAS